MILNPSISSPRKSIRHSKSRSSASATQLQWFWMAVFLVVLALLGGSSRPDPVQLAMLRPMAALLLIPAMYYIRLDDLAPARIVLLFLGGLLLWMVVQLVPLPPGLWQGLPDRETIVALDRLAGNADVWRPISLAPFRGLNSLLSLIVPVCALLLAVSMKLNSRLLLTIIAGLGLVNALFGLLQVVGGSRSFLYLYSITNIDTPVGLFANENHSAVFSALSLLAVTRLFLDHNPIHRPVWMKLAFVPVFLIILFTVLISASRAGLMATLFAIIASGLMGWMTVRSRGSGKAKVKVPETSRKAIYAATAGFALVVLLIVVAFLWLERTPAFQDLMGRNSMEDLRWKTWPVFQTMVSNHWLLGTGFGSFDTVYRLYEPDDLLARSYLNHAHNDWVQIVIEGGVPAALLLVGLLIWLARFVRTLLGSREHQALAVFCLAVLAIIGSASLVDYPARTPIFQAVLVWLFLAVVHDARAVRAGSGEGRSSG